MATPPAPQPSALLDGGSSTYEIQTPLGSRSVRVERIEYGESGRAPLRVSIIVPTLDRRRGGLLDRLVLDLRDQTHARFELLLVIGDSRQGRAINRGVQHATGDIIVTMDDDTRIGTRDLLRNLVEALDADPGIGMIGASTVVPPDAQWFQRAASRQIPRRLFPVTEQVTDSDMVQHPCLAMRKEVFLAIGGEDEELVRGLDPLLRFKVRRAGLRVAIAPHTYISHPLPDHYWSVVRMYFRNGRGSAFAQRHYPDRIYNLDDGSAGDAFPAKVAFPIRALRYPGRVLKSLCTGQWIRMSVEIAYVAGYLREYVARSPRQN